MWLARFIRRLWREQLLDSAYCGLMLLFHCFLIVLCFLSFLSFLPVPCFLYFLSFLSLFLLLTLCALFYLSFFICSFFFSFLVLSFIVFLSCLSFPSLPSFSLFSLFSISFFGLLVLSLTSFFFFLSLPSFLSFLSFFPLSLSLLLYPFLSFSTKSCYSHLLSATALDYWLFSRLSLFSSLSLSLSLSCSLLFALSFSLSFSPHVLSNDSDENNGLPMILRILKADSCKCLTLLKLQFWSQMDRKCSQTASQAHEMVPTWSQIVPNASTMVPK